MSMETTSTDGNGTLSERRPPERPALANEPLESAAKLLEEREYAAAVALLLPLAVDAAPAEIHAALGTAYTLLEQYEDAARELDRALKKKPKNEAWAWQGTLAAANAVTHVVDPYPPVDEFERDALLGEPKVAEGAIPPAPHARVEVTPVQWLLREVGKYAGVASTKTSRLLAGLAGRLGIADAVWTNWYRKPTALGLFTLAYMREQLDAHNLKDSYPQGELTGFLPNGLVPPPGVQHFRTPDGTWNNLANPKEGAAFTRFPRNVRPDAAWPEEGNLLRPNPAEISHVLLTRGPEGMKEVPFLNLLAASWIQFMVHDWVSHRVSYQLGVHEVPLPPEHPARKLYHQKALYVPKTMADPTRSAKDAGLPPTTINEVTSWWDGSQIYGSDQRTSDSLRTFKDGRLKIDEDGRLPLGQGNIEHTGFNRNWWLGLAMLHTLFVKEHNAIAEALQKKHPTWTDNYLFNIARLINAAVMAKIHTVEWTPAILPNHGLYLAMNANWFGFAETLARRAGRRKLQRPIKILSPEVGGIVGGLTNKHGAPYGLTEEFTEVYMLHELLPDEILLRSLRGNQEVERLPLAGTRQVMAHKITARRSFEDLFYSFGVLHPGQIVLNNFPRTLQQLSVPGNPLYDLGAVDILRARERGVPRYNQLREQLGLKPLRYFEDLTSDGKTLAALKSIYDDVNAIDLHVGSRAEETRPFGFGFGETLFQVFILMASRRLEADRFFTESYNEETYTKEGLDWVDDATFKTVLLRHHPELAATGLASVNNAFEPWDTGVLDPSRHPLRAFE
ncbi:MAG TPA: peroxidase family protein [Polyangiaceae bacterium]|jgi:hypothetical protein